MLVQSLKRLCGKAWLRGFGWRIEGSAPGVRKAVLLAAPHTSNWDMPFMLACAWSLGVEFRFVAKHTLFRGPLGPFMRALGGMAVDRRARHRTVDRFADLFVGRDELFLVIAPEGTRSAASHWKTGFYFTAKAANVPIVLGYLDYARKVGGMGDVLWPSSDPDQDLEQIREYYQLIQGRYPKRQGTIAFCKPMAPTPAKDDAAPVTRAA